MGNSQLLTADEAAAMLGVSPLTIKRWRLSGLLPYVRLGPRITRVRREVVEEILRDGLSEKAGA